MDLFVDKESIDKKHVDSTLVLQAAIKDVVPDVSSNGRCRAPWNTQQIVSMSRRKRRAYRKAKQAYSDINRKGEMW